MNKPKEGDWLDSMGAASRYGVSVDLMRQWRKWRDFPEDAVQRIGPVNFWNAAAIDEWLRSRSRSKHGPAPRWRPVVEAHVS